MSSASQSWFDLCGLVAAIGWALLVLGSQFFNTPLDLVWFGVGLGMTWLGLIGGYLCARVPGAVKFQKILLWALVFRVIVWFSAPVYEDDYFRYLWDGRAFSEEGTPYARSPIESFGDSGVPTHFAEILSHLNNPQLTTVYPPLAEGIFYIIYQIAPGETWPLKMLLALADILLIYALSQLVSPRQSLLYAWCPLVLFESYFNLHPELFGVMFIALGILHLSRREHTPAAVISVLAVGIKPLALPVALWIGWKCKTWERFVMGVLLISLYAYFVWHDGWSVFSSWGVMATQWEFNSFLYGMAHSFLPEMMAKVLCMTVFALLAVFWVQYTVRHSSEVPRFDWFYLGFFALSPVVNSWYLLWLLPWVILRPQIWTMTALAVVSFSYCVGQNLGDSSLAPYGHPDWVRPLEFGAVLMVGLFEGMIHAMQRSKEEAEAT